MSPLFKRRSFAWFKMGAGAYSKRYCQFPPRMAGFSNIRSRIWWIDTWYDHSWWEGKNFFFRCLGAWAKGIWTGSGIGKVLQDLRATPQPGAALPIEQTRQLVERCTGTAEVKGSNLVQAWIFFRLSFCSCKSSVYNCDDLLSYNSSPRSSHIWFSCIHSFSFIFVKWKKSFHLPHNLNGLISI